MSHENIDYEGALRRAGYRVTRQRLLILDAVCEGGGHTTLKEVFARVQVVDKTVELSSLYRALKLFVKLGVVVAATSDGETYFEIPHARPHHHLICTRCAVEQEIGHDVMASMFGLLRVRHDFEATSNHLVIHGVCGQCLKKEICES